MEAGARPQRALDPNAGDAVGVIFNLQRFSTHDGPGIRTTVFLKGCPLHCPWCHNPEGLRAVPEIMVRLSRCMGCGACHEVCTTGAAAPAAPVRAACTACGACVEVCPTAARELVGCRRGSAELVAELLRDRVFFEQSGGGVTFSGGEPLAQPEFLFSCLRLLAAHGVHVAVDTSGVGTRPDVEQLGQLADLVLFDLKTVDRERHRQLVGVELDEVLASLDLLCRQPARVWLRLPVVPGVSDDPTTVTAAIELAASRASIEKICLLPYHALGSAKYRQLDRAPSLEYADPGDMIADLVRLVQRAGLEVVVGG